MWLVKKKKRSTAPRRVSLSFFDEVEKVMLSTKKTWFYINYWLPHVRYTPARALSPPPTNGRTNERNMRQAPLKPTDAFACAARSAPRLHSHRLRARAPQARVNNAVSTTADGTPLPPEAARRVVRMGGIGRHPSAAVAVGVPILAPRRGLDDNVRGGLVRARGIKETFVGKEGSPHHNTGGGGLGWGTLRHSTLSFFVVPSPTRFFFVPLHQIT